MKILSIALILFIILETLNIILLYFVPESKKGNGVGVFLAYEKSKDYPDIHALIKYLVNWVAGTKIIFIALLLVVFFTGDLVTRQLSVLGLIATISVFFWRLFPSIRKMDMRGELSPQGYSKTLGIMIGVFLAGFSTALIISWI